MFLWDKVEGREGKNGKTKGTYCVTERYHPAVLGLDQQLTQDYPLALILSDPVILEFFGARK